MPIRRAMLMAAGLGTRLKPFTELAPKAFFPVMGVPAAQFAVDAAVAAGVRTLVMNVHHHARSAIEQASRLDLGGSRLVISDESSILLGSAGGIKKALPYFEKEPFFLLNADVLCDVDLAALARAHERLRARWGVKLTLAVHPAGPAPGEYAEVSFDAERGLVTGLGERATGRPFFIGAAVIEPEALEKVPAGAPAETVPLIFRPAIEEGRAGFFRASGPEAPWKDVGSPALWLESHLSLIRDLETGRVPPLWRKRIESASARVAQGIWTARREGFINHARATRWEGPCYWAGEKAPKNLGPNAVLYGDGGTAALSNGIGYQGLWVQL